MLEAQLFQNGICQITYVHKTFPEILQVSKRLEDKPLLFVASYILRISVFVTLALISSRSVS